MDNSKVFWRYLKPRNWSRPSLTSSSSSSNQSSPPESPTSSSCDRGHLDHEPSDNQKYIEPSTPAMDYKNSSVLHRNLHIPFLRLSSGKKSRLFFEDGRTIIDASGGAAVAVSSVLSHVLPFAESILRGKISQSSPTTSSSTPA